MGSRIQIFSPDQTDPRQQHRLFLVDQICLFIVVQIALINLIWRIFPSIDSAMPATLLHMRVSTAGATLCAALALFLAEAGRATRILRISQAFALLTVLVAALPLLAPAPGALGEIGRVAGSPPLSLWHGMPPMRELAFMLLGVVILLIRSGNSIVGYIADGLTSAVCFLVLVLLSDLLFGLVHIPGSSMASVPPIASLVCVALMALVAVLQRAEHGIFSVFVGYGIGSRIARILIPILLVLPFSRELLRARLMNLGLVPEHYVTPILTSVATIVAITLLVVLSRLINRMQSEIQDLTLRDELTGLYSVRGFNLLAEQAFRHARRAQSPFGVLFIDMDNLKLINDELGHSTGSVSLVETAKLLTANFRETDVIGRVGGDEFVVAGEFNSDEMAAIVNRVRSAAALKNHGAKKHFSISLSVGFAAMEHPATETLKGLVAKADMKMYKEKRKKKKMAQAGEPVQSEVFRIGGAQTASIGTNHNGGAGVFREVRKPADH